jgi:hypothetical protein
MADQQPFNFADNVGANFGAGMALGQKAQELKIAQQKAAEDAISKKFERIKGANDDAIKVFSIKELPDSVKLQHYNEVFVPAQKLLSGVTLPALDKWPDWGKEFADRYQAITDAQADGKIKAPTARAALGALFSEYSGKLPESVFALTKDLAAPKATVHEIKSGPDGATTAQVVNEYGEPGQVLGHGTPKPAGGDHQLRLEGSIKADENDLLTLVRSKDGVPNVEGGFMRKMLGSAPKWDDFNKKDQAQIALLQSKVQRLKVNQEENNKLRMASGMAPIEIQPEVAQIADRLSKIQGLPKAAPAEAAQPAKGAPEEMVSVQIPNGPKGRIPKSALAAFKKDHPNAILGK